MKFRIALLLAALPLAGAVAVPAPASAAPAQHRNLCDHARHEACVNFRFARATGATAGRGRPVRIVTVGRVNARWPFAAATELGTALAGHRVVQVHLGRGYCLGDWPDGRVGVRWCWRATLWVRDGMYLAGVRATDAAVLPCYLAAFGGSGPLLAVTLNGHAIGYQEWTVRR